jgi:hypothetical protein
MRRSPGRAITASSLSPNIRWFVPFSIAPALPPLWSEVGCVASSSFSAILKGNNNNEHNYNGQALFLHFFSFLFSRVPLGAKKVLYSEGLCMGTLYRTEAVLPAATRGHQHRHPLRPHGRRVLERMKKRYKQKW